ncbi:MAG TPA: IclR family transcriptional regulator [Candidatus Omnitrophica bacterium]|nr:IclR family transcriptional regulator [Candidatus Omnitrophota bacterium]
MAETTYRRIEAVAKAIAILEFLATQKHPVGGPEIARAVDMPVATVMSQIITLQDHNFVRNLGAGFELGMGAALIWARKKSLLAGERSRIDNEITKLEG